MAKKIIGAKVIGITSTTEKCRYLTETLGADAAINYKEDDLEAKLK